MYVHTELQVSIQGENSSLIINWSNITDTEFKAQVADHQTVKGQEIHPHDTTALLLENRMPIYQEFFFL